MSGRGLGIFMSILVSCAPAANAQDLPELLSLPVLLRLAGRAGWASPAWLTRILPTVRFSH